MATQVAQDVRLVAALAIAEILWRQPALIPQMTFQAVLPLVRAVAVGASPRLVAVLHVSDLLVLRQRLGGIGPFGRARSSRRFLFQLLLRRRQRAG